MAGGGSRDFLRARLWSAQTLAALALLASSVAAAAEPEAATAPAGPAAAVAASVVMPAAYYGMEEAPRGPDLLRAIVLNLHNGERTALGVPVLEWDDALAADAARYAAEMAQTGLFRHSPRGGRTIPSGENLWMGPHRLYGYQVMIEAFLDERKLFRVEGKLPNLSSTGRWQDVGHYTQMIWRGTKQVGCALGEGAQYDYLVCRYFPAGNAFGKGPLDVDEPLPLPSTPAVTPLPVAETVVASAAK
ncbi:CAP domain-containing protein [Sphingobium rhizovicinum]|uniref:CAP domain-containing protein n=1 Tax=Sphingobium rhizovicinum TaxID=432308 RepID=A0ABV7NFL2_9SPHN